MSSRDLFKHIEAVLHDIGLDADDIVEVMGSIKDYGDECFSEGLNDEWTQEESLDSWDDMLEDDDELLEFSIEDYDDE